MYQGRTPDVTSRYPEGEVMDGMVLQVGEYGSTDQMTEDGPSGIGGRAVVRTILAAKVRDA